MGWTLEELAGILRAELKGDPKVRVLRPVPAGTTDPEGVTFAESKAYFERVLEGQVGAVIVGKDAPELPFNTLIVDSPRLAFFQLLHLCDRKANLPKGIHPSALIDPMATIDPSASIGAFVVVEAGATVGPAAQVFPHCYIGPRCSVGQGSRLMPSAVLVQDVTVGERCLIFAGAVIGSDGFGYVYDGSKQVKIPQVGGVRIEDDVEIGSNTTVDRATSGETFIGHDVKLDNLVMVGHNAKIGANTVLAAHVGVSGSVTIGERVSAGGQAGFADHLTVGDDIHLAGRTGLMGDLLEPGEYFGVPPVPIKQALRMVALQQKLPDLVSRIRALEKEVERLKNGS